MRSLLNEDGRLTPRARVLWELEQKFGRVGMAEVASNMQLDIRSRALAALEQGAKRREQAADPQSLRDYQQYVLEQFLACHGGLPRPTPLSTGRCSPRRNTTALCWKSWSTSPGPRSM